MQTQRRSSTAGSGQRPSQFHCEMDELGSLAGQMKFLMLAPTDSEVMCMNVGGIENGKYSGID